MNIQDTLLGLENSQEQITILEADNTRNHLTYSALIQRALCLTGALQHRGLAVGTPVLIQCNGIEATLIALWGAILGGYVPAIVPATSNFEWTGTLLDAWTITDTETAAGTSGTRVLPFRALTHGKPGRVVHRADEDDGYIQFTSGTTSGPKGAVLSLKNLLEGGIASSVVVRSEVRERYISFLPLSHCFGLVANHIVPLTNGFAQMLIHPACFMRSPEVWLTEAWRFGATISGLPMFGVEALLKAEAGEADLSAMHICFVGGEDVSPACLAAFEEKFAPNGWKQHTLSPAYGLSETTMGVAYTPEGHAPRVDAFLNETLAVGERIFFCEPAQDTPFRVSVGGLDACNTVEIRDDNGCVLPQDYLGHIYIRGTNVMKGYYPQQEKHEGVGADGYFYTGDLGWFHRGWLTIYGRSKNILIHNGKNLLTTDLERSTGLYGQAVLVQAYIDGVSALILAGPAGRERLAEGARRMAAAHGILPDYCLCLPVIPVTASGKTDRLRLMNDIEQGNYKQHLFATVSQCQCSLSGKYAEMAEIWADVLHLPAASIALETHFAADLGGDSLRLTDLLWRLEQKTGRQPEPKLPTACLTLQQMADFYL